MTCRRLLKGTKRPPIILGNIRQLLIPPSLPCFLLESQIQISILICPISPPCPAVIYILWGGGEGPKEKDLINHFGR